MTDLWFKEWADGKLLNWGWLMVFYGHGMFWVKAFGHRVKVKDVKRNPLLFSERNRKPLANIGKWRIEAA